MAKRASYEDMIDLPDDPGPAEPQSVSETAQEHDHTAVSSNNRMKTAKPKRGKRAVEAITEGPAYIQRSLYATEQTFERIRKLAFDTKRPAQEFYREGLFLVMKKYGIDGDVDLNDV